MKFNLKNKILRFAFKDAPPLQAILQKSEPEYDWQYVMTRGHVIFARMNDVRKIGFMLQILVVLALILFYMSASASFKLVAYSLSEQPRVREQEAKEANLDDSAIESGSRRGVSDNKFAQLTKESELPNFVKVTLSSLNQNSQLAMPCYESRELKMAWANSTGEVTYPMCLLAKASGDAPPRVYVFALINSGGIVKNWLGVFTNETTGLPFLTNRNWVFKNIEIADFMSVPGFKSIEVGSIKRTMMKDFADLSDQNSDQTSAKTVQTQFQFNKKEEINAY